MLFPCWFAYFNQSIGKMHQLEILIFLNQIFWKHQKLPLLIVSPLSNSILRTCDQILSIYFLSTMMAVIRWASRQNAVGVSLSTSSSILFYLVTLMFYAAPTNHSSCSVHFTMPSLLLGNYSNSVFLIWMIFFKCHQIPIFERVYCIYVRS